MTAALEGHRLHEAAELCHGFVWGDFCDWYLELVKGRLEGTAGEASQTRSSSNPRPSDAGVAPIAAPDHAFVITDAIARRMPGVEPSFSLVPGPWPDSHAGWEDPVAEEELGELQELIGTVRTLRAEYGVDPGARMVARVRVQKERLERVLAEEDENVRRLAGLEAIQSLEDDEESEPGAHAVLRSGTELFVPLRGVIDLEHERERMRREVERISGLRTSTRGKLSNKGFLANAPEEVVNRERAKEQSLTEQHDRLEEKLRALGSEG